MWQVWRTRCIGGVESERMRRNALLREVRNTLRNILRFERIPESFTELTPQKLFKQSDFLKLVSSVCINHVL